MESALQYQITYEYNKTALPSNVTDAETNRITAAWDIMQIEVNASSLSGFIVGRHATEATHLHRCFSWGFQGRFYQLY